MSRSARSVVSVVIPTYADRARLLKRSLASVYAQRGAGEQFELEVIVADNASTPATMEVIDQCPGLIRLRFETNRGLWATLNAGLKAATGRFVAFLIDDDLWLEDKLIMQVPVLFPPGRHARRVARRSSGHIITHCGNSFSLLEHSQFFCTNYIPW